MGSAVFSCVKSHRIERSSNYFELESWFLFGFLACLLSKWLFFWQVFNGLLLTSFVLYSPSRSVPGLIIRFFVELII